jgi:hypothetical protein
MDKHGALTVLFGIMMQSLAVMWWASSISSQVAFLQEDGRKREVLLSVLTKTVADNAERTARIETVQENIVKILDRLSDKSLERP